MRRGSLYPAQAFETGGAAALQPPVFLASTQALLCEGGDQRIVRNQLTGLNAYGCAPRPDPDLIAFGSSTASTISGHGLDAAESLRQRLLRAVETASPAAVYEREAARLRAELVRHLGLAGVSGLETVLAASGTDLHMLIAQLIAGGAERPTLVIMGEPSDTGSGVPAALAGRYYGACAPFAATTTRGALIAGSGVDLAHVAARQADGRPRDTAVVDAEVEALASQAIGEGRRVLLVITDISKTGLISPSPACALSLGRRFPGSLDVLVDACQLRLSAGTLTAYAERGWMIAATGSKFLSGPAFSGALFVPRSLADRLRNRIVSPKLAAFSARGDWPEGWAIRGRLDPRENFGLLLRWEAALEELRRLRTIPESEIGRFLEAFAEAGGAAIAREPSLEALPGRPLDRGLGEAGGWDQAHTILPFVMRTGAADARLLTGEETARVYELMRRDLAGPGDTAQPPAAGLRIELGQPVACGERDGAPVWALRLCASARLIVEACGDAQRRDDILRDVDMALAKAAWLARDISAGRAA